MGSGPAISSVVAPTITALSPNRVAFIDANNITLRTYQWSTPLLFVGTSQDYPYLSVSDAGFTTAEGLDVRTILTVGQNATSTWATSTPAFVVNGTSVFSGLVGIGTSSPIAQLTVLANSLASTTNLLFLIASTTNTGLATTTNSHFVVTNTGNVGIGTAAPSTLLHLSASSPIIRLTDTDTSGSAEVSANSSSGSLTLAADVGSTVSNSAINFFVDDAQVARFISNGNFGIGSTSPYAKLTVHANNGETNLRLFEIASSTQSATTTLFSISNAGIVGIGTSGFGARTEKLQVDGSMSISNGSLYRWINTAGTETGTSIWGSSAASAGYMHFYLDGFQRMSILTGGNVGIGSSSPWGLLSVNPNGISGPSFVIGSSTATNFIVKNSGLVGVGTTSTADVNGANALTIEGAGQTNVLRLIGGSSQAGFYMNSGSTFNGVQFGSTNSTGVGLYTANGTPTFHLDTNGGVSLGAYAATINGSVPPTNGLIVSGTTGIGSSSPFAKLSVHANNGDTATTLFAIGSSTQSATTTLFSISNTGNVGIGTEAPSAQLDIYGGTAFQNLQFKASSDSLITLASGLRTGTNFNFNLDSNAGVIVNIDTDNNSSNSFFVRSNGSATDLFTVIDTGNIGVASTTPWGLLSVNPNGISGPSFVIGSSTATNFIVTNAGSVGIGTTSPSRQFEISGTGAQYARITSTDDSTASLELFRPGNSFLDWRIRNTGGDLIFAYSDDDLSTTNTNLYMKSSGEIGIGTTSPFARLSVATPNNSTGSITTMFVIASSTQTGTTSLFKIDNTGVLTLNSVSTSTISGGLTVATGGLQVSTLTSASCDVKADTSGNLSCGTDQTALGAANPFTWENNFGVVAAATTSRALFTNGLSASTTVDFGNAGVSSFHFDGTTGKLGLGTTSATGNLSIENVYGSTNTTLFSVASSTAVDGSTASTLFTITNTGNVGIGSSSPSSALAIERTSGSALVTTYNGTVRGHFGAHEAGNLDIGTQSNHALSFETNDITRMTLDTTGNLGIGSSTPYAKLSVHANNGDTNIHLFEISSSTQTATTSLFVVHNNGHVGIGTSTPFARFSIQTNNAADERFPAFVIATTSLDGPGQDVLLYVGATTTGALDFARVAIGTTSVWGTGGIRDQLTVAGRIYSTWRYAGCDFPAMSQTAAIAASTLVPNFCGGFAFVPTTNGATFAPNNSQAQTNGHATGSPIVLSTVTSAATAIGQGSAVRALLTFAPANTNPVLEAVVANANNGGGLVAASSSIIMVGFDGTSVTATPVIGREPDFFIGFIASSSTTTGATGAPWYALVKNGNSRSIMSTGVSSSTLTTTGTSSPQRLRVEVSSNRINFLINGNVVLATTTNIPNVNLTPTVSVASAITHTNARANAPQGVRLLLYSMRFWMDDPPGGVTEGVSGPPGSYVVSEPEAIKYDWETLSNISQYYQLANTQESEGAAGNLVSIDHAASSSAKATARPYDPGLLGVVNNTAHTTIGRDYAGTSKVAISGRAMVNVTSENGAIKPGDPITSSSLVGQGMKATKPGFIIGRALESLYVPNASSTVQCPAIEGTTTPMCSDMILVEINVGFAMNTDEGTSTLAAALAVPAKLADALGELAGGVFEKAVQFVSLTTNRLIAKVAIIGDLFADHITATVINADQVNAKTLCLDDLCVTKTQLQQLLDNAGASGSSSTPPPSTQPPSGGGDTGTSTPPGDTGTGSTGSPQATSTSDTEAPVITISGNNPATIDIGASYVDLGATVTDNVDQNLGYTVSLDGGAPTDISQLSLDTSIVGEHSILFSATDLSGNTGTATRTVIVASSTTP